MVVLAVLFIVHISIYGTTVAAYSGSYIIIYSIFLINNINALEHER